MVFHDNNVMICLMVDVILCEILLILFKFLNNFGQSAMLILTGQNLEYTDDTERKKTRHNLNDNVILNLEDPDYSFEIL